MRTPGRERGMSLWSLAFLLFLVVFFGLLVVKLAGPYYDQFTLDQMIDRAVTDMAGSEFSESEFRDRLNKNLNINNIELDLRKDLSFETRSNDPKVVLDYEKRIHIFGNVDVVLSFHEEYGL
ncbi:DUF4845 domain-containing protein [Saccharospirillum salsuginis]|uniref:DUF4845 domain-containing protein n=1 Tax=Saccharospirillum salsuginis TaxID=418750 RepID=A0A918KNP3_9GAMM|nr:DUF4845 domain-containing protein [Saccharospirillum salsuginis]GGX69842.1 hypothetical protein GCM10007392_41800 [Saccharospirillum salsuginis]